MASTSDYVGEPSSRWWNSCDVYSVVWSASSTYEYYAAVVSGGNAGRSYVCRIGIYN